MLTGTLFIIAPNHKQCKFPPTDKWTEETCHVICTREYYSAMKTLNNDMCNNEKFQTKKEIRQEKLNSLDSRKCRLIYSERRVAVGWEVEKREDKRDGGRELLKDSLDSGNSIMIILKLTKLYTLNIYTVYGMLITSQYSYLKTYFLFLVFTLIKDRIYFIWNKVSFWTLNSIPLLYISFLEFQKNIYFCFIDYSKAFDCVDHNKVQKILQEMGIPDHLTCFLRNLYAGQEATLRTGHGTRDWFQIG